MVSFGAWLKKKLRKEKKAKVLILGLDAAGKTTLTNYLKLREFTDTVPTIGQQVETINIGGWTITVIDVAGQKHFRFLWDAHYPGTEGIIFVIDSADISRLPENRQILEEHVINNPFLEGKPILILANKQDLPEALPPEVLIQALGLHTDTRMSSFAVFGCSILYGTGVDEAMQWIIEQLEKRVD